MDLNELKEKALSLKEKNTKLCNEKKVKETKLAEIVKRNYEGIVLPYVISMNDFMQKLNPRSFELTKKYLIDTNESQLIECPYSRGILLDFHSWKYGFTRRMTTKESCKDIDNESWLLLADFFGSVDSCNSFIAGLNAEYSRILEHVVELFEKENSSLIETLQDLIKRIRNSSCVEEKEDGSIEINVNGKTYIGILKEV